MWFEAIPSIAIVAACLHIGPYGNLIVNYLFANRHVSVIAITEQWAWPIGQLASLYSVT